VAVFIGESLVRAFARNAPTPSGDPMLNSLLTSLFGSRNERLLRQFQKNVARINAYEAELEKLDDDALRGKTAEFKARVAEGATLDQLLPEAFAVCREASRRVLGLRL
jgi:preprotein translocase subunit SecA